MKCFLAALILLFSLWMLGGNAQAAEANDKNALVRIYAEYRELLANANSEDIIAMETYDFTKVFLTGDVLNKQKADTLTRLAADQIVKVNAATLVINQLFVKPHRAMAVVTKYTDTDRIHPLGYGNSRIQYRLIERHIWVPTEDGWKIKRIETLGSYATADGKYLLSLD